VRRAFPILSAVPRAVVIALLAFAFPASALAQAEAPVFVDDAGGAQYGHVDGLTAPAFSVAPGTATAGSPVTVSVRIAGPDKRVRARVVLGGSVLKLGRIATGATVTRRWTPQVTAGDYVAQLRVRGRAGRRLVRTPRHPGTFPVSVVAAAVPQPIAASADGVFPIQGTYSFGNKEARFGAARNGHVHQGQDVFAAEGTPLVSPVAGVVYWRKVQKGGAGHYLVIRADSGIDYVFMHLVAGSELVEKGDAVKAGDGIGQVGHTGDAVGPHLHFEIWPDGWYAPDSKPIDPLPQLKAWAAGSS
jgi:murein DD-endopeptidase MepM/ murein hydrolase activator NlpD